MKNNYLISVVGPTAIGKTALGIQIAEYFRTEIISADSRQFYKEMSIGTAVPSEAELEKVKHHFIQYKSIKEPYSVGDFERDALEKLDSIFQTKNTVVMVGGSGLYIDSVIKGLDNFPEVENSIREKLNTDFNEFGLEYLQNQLKKLDPEYYKTVDINNRHRIIRALEISIGTGQPYSSFLKNKKTERPFHAITVGITAPREMIYDRINRRVDLMIENGLLTEAEHLYPFKNLNALNTVGYKELFAHFNNEVDLNHAISEIKKNTRRFAKRQMTWFKKDNSIIWFDYDTPISEIVSTIESHLR